MEERQSILSTPRLPGTPPSRIPNRANKPSTSKAASGVAPAAPANTVKKAAVGAALGTVVPGMGAVGAGLQHAIPDTPASPPAAGNSNKKAASIAGTKTPAAEAPTKPPAGSKTKAAAGGIKNAAVSSAKSGKPPTVKGAVGAVVDNAAAGVTQAKEGDTAGKAKARKVAAGGVAVVKAGAEVGAGFATGGWVGAGKSAAMIVLRNRKARNITIGVVAVLVFGQLASSLVGVGIGLASMTAFAASNQYNAQLSASAGGVDDEVALSDEILGQQSGVPWTVLSAYRRIMGEDPDTMAFAKALDKRDSGRALRSLDTGAAYQTSGASRVISDQDEMATAQADAVSDVYVDALATLPEVGEAKALRIYKLALAWWLGQQSSCGVTALDGASSLTVKGVTMDSEQEQIALTIIGITKTAFNKGPSANTIRAAEIAVATAIVESVLRNHDTKVDHTSLGVFQQQDWWGTDEQRLDPAWSTARFYQALLAVDNWNTMPPGEAAQAVQVSAFPDEYAKRMGEAKSIVATLWGNAEPLPVPDDIDLGGDGTAELPEIVCLGGNGLWVAPFNGTPTVTSWYGPRKSPTTGASTDHKGVDFDSATNDPIFAVAAGFVAFRGQMGSCGNGIMIDHGDAVTLYCHMVRQSPLNATDVVSAGQEIGQVGSTGASSGPHIHFGVTVEGQPVDPVVFMLERGVDFTALPYTPDAGPWEQ
jgi:murein DD-endopeptidase MepM/ murein hydrolase activator NlpD